MWKLLKYLKAYKKESVLGPLFKLLEASFELLVPLVMAKVIDVGIKNQDLPYIFKMGGILLFLGMVGMVCSLTAQYFAAKAAMGFGTALRNDLYAHINGLSYSEIDSVGTSTLITRMTSDVNQVQSGVNLVLRLFLRSPFIVLGAMVMAFTIDVKAALVFAVAIPLLAAVVFGIMLVSMPLYRRVQRQLDKVMLAARENLVGVRVIRAFNKQQKERKDFEAANDQLVKFQVFVGKISALLNPLTYIIINLATVVLIWVGALQVDGGILTQGAVVALVNYMSQILVELIKLANLIINVSKSLACANRITAVFEIQSSIREKTDGSSLSKCGEGDENTPVVEFSSLDFIYGGGKEPSLSGISFQVKRGETVGIIGGTGSGKTTLVNLIPRFYDAAAGAVKIDGRDVRELGLYELRSRVGVVPQRAVLFKGSLRDNMKWGKKEATDQEIFAALKTAQAIEFVEEKEEGLELAIEQGGKNLSGGQRQRLTIARALVRKPEILILDDSASALDFATDAKLRAAIKKDTEHMTVFLVSQRAATVRYADKILVLDDGNLVGAGKHSQLMEDCQVYREICLSQLSKEEVK